MKLIEEAFLFLKSAYASRIRVSLINEFWNVEIINFIIYSCIWFIDVYNCNFPTMKYTVYGFL